MVNLVWTSYDEELGSCTVNWKSQSSVQSVNSSFPDANSDSLTEMDFKESSLTPDFGGHEKIGHGHLIEHKKSIEKQLQKETNFNPEENQKACEQFFLENSLKPGKTN